MNNLLKQMDFGDLTQKKFPNEVWKKKRKKSKRKRKSKNINTKPQMSMFELITGLVKEEKQSIIENPVPKTNKNYTLKENIITGLGSIKERLLKNIKAIKLVKSLKKNNNFANFMEQNALAQFTSFGIMQEVFDTNSDKYKEEKQQLQDILTPEEYESAKATVNNAFFTDTKIIDFLYKVIKKLGFKGGDILEPSCGIGNFFGAMPNEIKFNSTLKGVELDTLTGEIAKQLYQQADIEISPFEESLTYDKYYDLVIGNVPFGKYSVFDKEYNKYNLSIHNYFIVKSLDKLRVGGLLAVVTSKFTMDSKLKKHRELIKEKAKVIACFRLPKGAFKEYAGTNALTDIIILQKTDHIGTDNDTESFIDIDDRGINNYYVAHPENILGNLEEVSGMFGKELAPILPEGTTLEKLFKKSLVNIPENVYEEYEGVKEKFLPSNNFNVKPGGYDFINGELVQNQGGTLVKVDKVKNKKTLQMYKDFVELKKHVHRVLQEQVRKCSDETLQELQKQLNTMYDRFVYKYQYIDTPVSKKKFKEDPDYPLLCALEIHTETEGVKKADIFYKRTIKNDLFLNCIGNAKDALSYCINKYGYVNMDFIKKIYKEKEEAILDELQGLIIKDPISNNYILTDEYLSGNVKKKLQFAKQAAETNEIFKENVAALEKVQPIPLTYDQIEIKLGTTYIPTEYYTEFLRTLINADKWEEKHVYIEYIEMLDEYKVYGNNVVSYSDNHQKWGTERKSACQLVELALNCRGAKVFDKVLDAEGKKHRVLNKEETINAETKQQLIKDKFKKWIYEDELRRKNIEKIYNEKFNSFVDKSYNGSLLTLPGKNPNIEFRDYQKNVVTRAIVENNSLLLFHHVGSGKSFEMMAIGMEMKRLGLCNKPLYVVPNHMVQSGQFAKEFLTLYPNAKILAATSDDFAKDKRMKLVSKIATCEWDAVIIGHSSLIKIPVSTESQMEVLKEQMKEIEEVIKDTDDRMTEKRFQTILKNQRIKLKKIKDIAQDNTIIFEELGIDQLFIDEAHNFKNLYTFSKMSNVAGVQNTSAKKTEDLYAKIQYIYKIRGEGKGVVFATGTPVSNSISELYIMQKYLQPQILKEQGIDTFDRWASVFGEVINSIEISPTGKGFKQKQRFAKFYNTPELTSIFRQCTDVVLKHQLDIPIPKANYHKIEIPAIASIKNYIDNVILPRAHAIANKRVTPEEDNMLKVTNDGRKAALDIRLVDPNAIIDGPTKISICAKNIYNIWEKTKDTKGTQLLFCDLGTPKISSNSIYETKKDEDEDEQMVDETDLFDDTFYDVYNEIQKILLEKGIPLDEIAFIHDAKTPIQREELINRFRCGKLRILLGSTSKMGEGMNAMDKIVAIHHIDVPWKPSSLEQRDGRGIRFGNENDEINIYKYVTKGTFDAFSWQTIQTKAKFIGQILCGMSNERNIDDIDVQIMNFAEMKAAASDNPLILDKFESEVQLKKLNVLEKNFIKNKYLIQNKISKLRHNKEIYTKNLIAFMKDEKLIKNLNTKIIKINNVDTELNLELIEKITPKINTLFNNEEIYIGDYLNMKVIGSKIHIGEGIMATTITLEGNIHYKINYDTQLSLLRRLSGFKEKLIDKRIPKLRLSLEECTHELEKLSFEYERKFPYTNALVETKNKLKEIEQKLGL